MRGRFPHVHLLCTSGICWNPTSCGGQTGCLTHSRRHRWMASSPQPAAYRLGHAALINHSGKKWIRNFHSGIQPSLKPNIFFSGTRLHPCLWNLQIISYWRLVLGLDAACCTNYSGQWSGSYIVRFYSPRALKRFMQHDSFTHSYSGATVGLVSCPRTLACRMTHQTSD